MLSLIVFLPLVAAAVLAAVPGSARPRVFVWSWIAVAAADVALVGVAWIRYRGGLGYEENLRWIPSAGVGYHVGVDGLSLPLVAMTSVLFLACAIYSLRQSYQVKSFVLLFLFLQTVSLGLFVALDLILFFVYFDLSIVDMYFVIAGWGHGQARRAALTFFLYTFVGSLALLLGWVPTRGSPACRASRSTRSPPSSDGAARLASPSRCPRPVWRPGRPQSFRHEDSVAWWRGATSPPASVVRWCWRESSEPCWPVVIFGAGREDVSRPKCDHGNSTSGRGSGSLGAGVRGCL